MEEEKSKFCVKDYVYLVDFAVNIGVIAFVLLKSYEVSGTVMGVILTEKGIILLCLLAMTVLVIFCQLFYAAGRLRGKLPDDMFIVSRWPNMWIVGKILILAGVIAVSFLGTDMVSLLFSV